MIDQRAFILLSMKHRHPRDDKEGGVSSHAHQGPSSQRKSRNRKRKRCLLGCQGRRRKKQIREGMGMEPSSPTSACSDSDEHLPPVASSSSSLVVTSRLVFPDALEQRNPSNDEDDDDANIANVFFELANSNEIAYHVRNRKTGDLLLFKQDMSVGQKHTGGIIWETSYLLLEYLLQTHEKSSLGRTLELGAGVGFLGQCLAAEQCCKQIVLTETSQVLVNLEANFRGNRSTLANMAACVTTCALDWAQYEQDVESSSGALKPNSFDTLLGTDVIFATNLVEPLLKTASFLSHSSTVWYLCVSIRCSVAHELFLKKAPDYGFKVDDTSEQTFASKRCAWGKSLDCIVYRITRVRRAK